jgi:hypothetical protein
VLLLEKFPTTTLLFSTTTKVTFSLFQQTVIAHNTVMNSQHYHLSSTGADGMSPFGLQPMAGQPLVATTGAPFGAGSQSMTTDQQANTSFMNASSSSNTNKSHNGMGGGGGSMGGGGGGMGGASDLLTAHRERGRMLQVLQQQQQQQQQQRQLTMSRGLPVLQTMAGHDIRTPGAGTSAQRFMVEDFASAGALLSRPEQDFLLRGYPNMGAPGMAAFPQADAMDLSHPSKLADFLFAKQAAVLNGAQMLPRVTRLPCQARGMKADHNSTVSPMIWQKQIRYYVVYPHLCSCISPVVSFVSLLLWFL